MNNQYSTVTVCFSMSYNIFDFLFATNTWEEIHMLKHGSPIFSIFCLYVTLECVISWPSQFVVLQINTISRCQHVTRLVYMPWSYLLVAIWCGQILGWASQTIDHQLKYTLSIRIYLYIYIYIYIQFSASFLLHRYMSVFMFPYMRSL